MIRQPLTIAELGNKGVRYDHAPQTDRRKKHLAECYDADDTLGIKFPNAFMMALSAENGFFRPFPLGKPRSLALLYPLFPSAPKR